LFPEVFDDKVNGYRKHNKVNKVQCRLLKAESVEVEMLIQCPAQDECYQHEKQVDAFFLCHVFDLIGLMKLHWPIAWANVKQSSMPANTPGQKINEDRSARPRPSCR
jgi:hypothetical protein